MNHHYKTKIAKIASTFEYEQIPVIEKEILHYEIMAFLQNEGFLDNLVFMGGTSLRLCYQSVRYSEDLDFVIKDGFNLEKMSKLADSMKNYFETVVGVGLHVNEPKSIKTNQRQNAKVVVDKWKFSFVTNSERRDLPRQKIKMEIADVPSYTCEIRPIKNNYQTFLGDYKNVSIQVESLEEVLADKIIAFNSTASNNIRYRDIWDIQWILGKDIPLNINFVQNKIKDYYIENFYDKMSGRLIDLKNIIMGESYCNQLNRFLDKKTAEVTVNNEQFNLQTYFVLKALFETVQSQLQSNIY